VNTAQPKRSSSEDRPSDTGAEKPAVKSKTNARQGVTGHGVRYVLAWSLAAVVLAFAIAYLVTAGSH
jgi:hypothetical protein